MCECCDDVINRSVKRSAEKLNIRGKALDIRIVAVAPEPRSPRTNVAATDEQARTAVEVAAAG